MDYDWLTYKYLALYYIKALYYNSIIICSIIYEFVYTLSKIFIAFLLTNIAQAAFNIIGVIFHVIYTSFRSVVI